MKSPQRTERRRSFSRQTAQRRRALLVEQLETRNLLCYGLPPLFDPPPDSYRSDNVSDDLARVAYEFDQWAAEPISRDFIPTDCEVLIRDGRVYVQALAVESGADLISELTSIDVEVVGGYEWAVAAWVPLSRLKDLKELQELKLAGIPWLHANVGQPAADAPVSHPLSPIPTDTAENVSGSTVESSEILDLPDIFDDDSDVPAQFRSSRVSDLLARAAFEFSQRPPTVSVHDFLASDAWVTVRDGSALIQAVSTSVSGEKLGEFLAAMGGRVLGSYGPGVSAWFPLVQIPELGNLRDLTFASPVLLFTNKSPGSVTPEDGMLRTDQLGSGELNVAEAGTCHDVHTEFSSPRVRDSLALATIALPHRSPLIFGHDVTATTPWATAKDGFARTQAVSALLVGEMLGESLTGNGGTTQGNGGPELNALRARQRIPEVANLVDLTSASLVLDGVVTEELDLDRLLDLAERAGCLEVGGMRRPKA